MKTALGVICILLALVTSAEGTTFQYVGGDAGLWVKIDNGNWTDLKLGGVGKVNALEVAPNSCGVLVGGDFQGIGGNNATGAVFIADDEYTPIQVSGTVHAVASQRDETTYVLGGEFASVNGVEAQNAAFWDMCAAASGVGSGFDGPVLAIAGMDNTTYFGGSFSQANGVTDTEHFAVYNENDGSLGALGSGGNDTYPFDGDVNAVGVVGSQVFAGGKFTASSNATVHGFAVYTQGSWLSPPGWASTREGTVVTGIASTDTHVVVVGTLFDVLGASSPCGVAVYDPFGGATNFLANCTEVGFDAATPSSVWNSPTEPTRFLITSSDGRSPIVVDLDEAASELTANVEETGKWAGAELLGGGWYGAVQVEDPGSDSGACDCSGGGGGTSDAGALFPSVFILVATVLSALWFGGA